MWTILLAALSAAAPNPCNGEVTRIQAHLDGALIMLEREDTSHLSEAQRANRFKNIERLREYRNAGRFPVNEHHPDKRTPYFRDEHGTLCAMGYLIEESGRKDIVDYVNETDNNAYVRELAALPALQDWLRENGMTAAEAARVQPTYGYVPNVGCICRSETVGVLDGIAISMDFNGDWEIRIRDVHGDSGGYSIDERINLTAYETINVGQRMLILVRDGSLDSSVLPLDENEEVGCADYGDFGNYCYENLTIAAENAVFAMLDAGNCSQYLHDKDPRWNEDCDNDGGYYLCSTARAIGLERPRPPAGLLAVACLLLVAVLPLHVLRKRF